MEIYRTTTSNLTKTLDRFVTNLTTLIKDTVRNCDGILEDINKAHSAVAKVPAETLSGIMNAVGSASPSSDYPMHVRADIQDRMKRRNARLEMMAMRALFSDMEEVITRVLTRFSSTRFSSNEKDVHFFCSSHPHIQRRRDQDLDEHQSKRAVADRNTKWKDNTIKWAFLNGGSYGEWNSKNEKMVQDAWDIWAAEETGLIFEHVNVSDDPSVTIGIGIDGEAKESYSLIGTDSRSCRPSMVIGEDRFRNDNGVLRTILHEIGHALGLDHEHQSPLRALEYDEEKTKEYFKDTWSEATTTINILDEVKGDLLYSNWDPTSIMMYPVQMELLTVKGKEMYTNFLTENGILEGIVGSNFISEKDVETLKVLYCSKE